MPIRHEDPTVELKNRKRQLDTMSPYAGMDDKELAEREMTAKAYALKNEKHFVDYAMDSIKQSVEAQKRSAQDPGLLLECV